MFSVLHSLCFSLAILALTLLNLVQGQSHYFPHDESDDFPHHESVQARERIIYGSVVDISDYPYQVALVWGRKGHRRIICGGALVRPKVVFTAAHCTHSKIYDEPRPNLSILVGANYLGDPEGHLYEIDRIVKHPDYSFHNYDHDFSAIVLKEAVESGDKARHVPLSDEDHEDGAVATISGWGRTETGRPSKYLRATKLRVEEWDKCQNYFPGVFHPKITKNMICVKPSRTTTYFGDSGGPLVVNGKLIGLVSFGIPVNRKKQTKTTVFTRVKNFLEFVENEVPEFSE